MGGRPMIAVKEGGMGLVHVAGSLAAGLWLRRSCKRQKTFLYTLSRSSQCKVNFNVARAPWTLDRWRYGKTACSMRNLTMSDTSPPQYRASCEAYISVGRRLQERNDLATRAGWLRHLNQRIVSTLQ